MQALRSHPLALGAVAAAAALAMLGIWGLRSFDPNLAGSPFPPCLFRAFTGLLCPGCGMTRALHALVHGDLAGMLAMNALLPVLMVLVPVVGLLGAGIELPLPARLRRVLLSAGFWLGLILGFGVLRNLPWEPFAWLAPG